MTLITALTPTVKNTFAFAQIDECNFRGRDNAPGCPGTNRDSYAIVDSLEFAVTDRLTAKPTFSYANFGGANTGTGSMATPARGGFSQDTRNSWRATIGGDLRWTSGPWSFEPTFHYQFGEQDLSRTDTTTQARDVDIHAWIVDVTGG